MINSSISSDHHYYVLFLDPKGIKSISNVRSIFDCESEQEIITPQKDKKFRFAHLQLELKKKCGTEDKRNLSKTRRKDGPYYWYDFYVGGVEIKNTTYYFICYPYSALGKFLEKSLLSNSYDTTFYKPPIEKVLSHLKDRSSRDLSLSEERGLYVEIKKYSAHVAEGSMSTTRVNLIGANPLKSRAFDVIKESGLAVETVALKLRCQMLDVGDVEISFDKVGNYRFWIKRDASESTISMLPFVFKFFNEIAPLVERDSISNNNLIEDE